MALVFYPVTLCHLIRAFRPFTFKVILDRYVLIANLFCGCFCI